jgi:hypothetical protein
MMVLPGDRYLSLHDYVVRTVSSVDAVGGIVTWTAGGRSGFGELGQWWMRVYG